MGRNSNCRQHLLKFLPIAPLMKFLWKEETELNEVATLCKSPTSPPHPLQT